MANQSHIVMAGWKNTVPNKSGHKDQLKYEKEILLLGTRRNTEDPNKIYEITINKAIMSDVECNL